MLVAESRLAEAAGVRPLREVSERGDTDEGRIKWEARVAPWEAPTAEPELGRVTENMPTRLYRIEVDVTFPGLAGGKQEDLARDPAARGKGPEVSRVARPPDRRRARGFTLLELVVALTLLALMSVVLFGALGFAGRSWEGGEAKAEQVSGMRLSEGYLRAQIESMHPLRMRKIAEFPLLFGGDEDELRYAAPLPSRVTGGGIWYYRLAVAKDGERSRLVLERIVPDVDAAAVPEFNEPDRSILAEDIATLASGTTDATRGPRR